MSHTLKYIAPKSISAVFFAYWAFVAAETAPVLTVNIRGEPGAIKPGVASQFTLNLAIELNRTANPPNVFWASLQKWPNAVNREEVSLLPVRPIDFLYVSSNCNPRREAMAAFIRARLIAENLTWAYGGRCTAGAPRSMASPHQGQRRRNEGHKDVAASKTMLSMSRSQDPALESLDEKLGLPVLYGATIPVYIGNGHRLIKEAKYPEGVIFDRNNFASDERFVVALVALLKNNTELLRRQREMYSRPFHFGSVPARVFMQAQNITFGPQGSPVSVYTRNTGRQRPQVFLDHLAFIFKGKYKFMYGVRTSPIHIQQCCW